MESIERKGRVRELKGKLINFNDLPQDKQLVFKHIKKVINDVLKKDVNTYVFGSYYWGFWDDLSDFDVTVEYELKENVSEIIESVNILRNENIKVDIQIKRGEMGILIP